MLKIWRTLLLRGLKKMCAALLINPMRVAKASGKGACMMVD